jgi:hypothetical protein
MKTANDPQPDLSVMRPGNVGTPTPLTILQAAIEGGVTAESVGVVERLAAMCREQRAEDARTAFNRAFFQLKREMPVLYADKQVRTKSGAVAFQYVSPEEIKNMLDPLMTKHGFCTMAGQVLANGEATVTVTLIHESGHSESRSFTVRVSPGNQLMTPTQCDASASSSAERHCLMKIFGLRTRLNESDDPRNIGDMVTPEQADELERRVKETNSNVTAFLQFGGSKTGKFSDIPANRYADCDAMLRRKEGGGR